MNKGYVIKNTLTLQFHCDTIKTRKGGMTMYSINHVIMYTSSHTC